MIKFASEKLTVGQLNLMVKMLGGPVEVLDILLGDKYIHLVEKIDKKMTLTNKTNDLLVNDGKYDYVNNNINNTNFPFDESKKGGWEWDLWSPKEPISSSDAKKACSTNVWSPGGIQHLLALGAKYPNLQVIDPIVCISDSVFLKNKDGVNEKKHPVLDFDYDDGRTVSLIKSEGDWPANYRFLRVKRV